MEAAHRRHDISDKVWELLEPHLPGREGTRGVTARDNRNFLNAVFGSCEQVRRGGICHLIMGTGKIPIADSVGGEIVACVKEYSKFLFLNQILNGS